MASSEELDSQPQLKKSRTEDSSGPRVQNETLSPSEAAEKVEHHQSTVAEPTNPSSLPAPVPPPTLYLRCKHIVKPWELLNMFIRDHRDALGVADLYAPDSATGAICLKQAANIRCVYVANSRKPYFLIELPTDESTERLLAMSESVSFKGELVHVQKAIAGATVEEERKRQDARKDPPQATAAARPAPATTTTFVPRIVKR